MDPVGVVTELARRFQARDGAGALRLFHPDIRIEQPASLPHGWPISYATTTFMCETLYPIRSDGWRLTTAEARVSEDSLILRG